MSVRSPFCLVENILSSDEIACIPRGGFTMTNAFPRMASTHPPDRGWGSCSAAKASPFDFKAAAYCTPCIAPCTWWCQLILRGFRSPLPPVWGVQRRVAGQVCTGVLGSTDVPRCMPEGTLPCRDRWACRDAYKETAMPKPFRDAWRESVTHAGMDAGRGHSHAAGNRWSCQHWWMRVG